MFVDKQTRPDRGSVQKADPRARKNISGKPCLRPRCNRKENLNENGICGGHACPYPHYVCKETKSNVDKFCELHASFISREIPKKGWAKVSVNDIYVWLNLKTLVAQYWHPGVKGENAMPRNSKLLPVKSKKGAPTHFVVTPQPPDLPDPWEQILAVPDMGKQTNYDALVGIGALFLYTNSADLTVQFSDPRPPPVDPNALPEGWEKGFDKDGDVYYINLDTDLRTYDDPRIVATPVASRSLSVDEENRLQRSINRELPAVPPPLPLPNNKNKTKKLHNTNPFGPPPTPQKNQPRTSTSTTSGNPFATSLTPIVETKKKAKPEVHTHWTITKCDMSAYEMLDDCLTFEDEIPREARNKTHNRYMDILPNPKTRVNLPKKQDPVNKATDYVNANWVVGPDGNERYYIAAMGPKPATVNTFWRMIWKVKPIAIVMITGLVEKGVQKCERYWPGRADGKEILEFGDVRVCTTASTPKNGYVRSTIKAVSFETLDVKGKLVSHTMEHFWYNTWPDHGVPRNKKNPLYTDDTLAMLSEVNAYAAKKKRKGMVGPILVHCSAGIGRTGTYMCIDHCLHDLRHKGTCDPVTTTAKMRQCRCALVQHPQQFKFAHQATVHYAELQGKPLQVINDDDDHNGAVSLDTSEGRRIEKAESASRSESESAAIRNKSNPRKRVSGLTMGVLEFEGGHYEFIDPDGNGKMDLAEATEAGFPRQLFRLLDKDRDGFVTPTEFKTYQRLQKQAAAQKRASVAAGNFSRSQTITARPHKTTSHQRTVSGHKILPNDDYDDGDDLEC